MSTQQKPQQESPSSQRYQPDGLMQLDDSQHSELSHGKDRDCFQDIELYLSQLNKQLPGPTSQQKTNDRGEPRQQGFKISKSNDFGTNLKAAFNKYYSNTNLTDPNQEFDKLNQTNHPKYNTDIFNPFRKASHDLKSRPNNSNNMKYDYRRGTPSDSGSAIDSGKNTAKHAHDYRKTYLFLYNVLLFVMFLMVFMILTIKAFSGTIDDDTVRGSAFIIKILTYTQLLESIHPILGLVPGGPMMPFLQVIGRLIVNHFLTEPRIRIDSAPYAHYLFIVWSCIEIFRYSFYALRVFKVDVYPITWCRYTLFMPLYPLGGFCESQVIRSTIEHYGKTGTYSIGLPNSANISFNLPSFLKFYTYILLGPSIFYLMRYMWSQRCKQLTKKEKMA